MDDKRDIFTKGLESSLHIKTNYDSKVLDYTWLEMFEETIPYIDNILRNPKKFIVNEEEVVPVEKSKKVTVESIIYLTQHTNLIQDIDLETNDVKPAKVLNINKEESLDVYENRFVYTLIKNMSNFYDMHKENLLGGAYLKDIKNATYEASAKIGNDNTTISVSFSSKNVSNNDENLDKSKGSIEDRLRGIKNALDGFRNSEMYITLERMHTPEVRSPIKKTNAIRKNPNFQKANDLWNYLQSYDKDDVRRETSNNDYMDQGEIKTKFDDAFLIQYLALNDINSEGNIESEKKMINMAISKVIEDILDIDDKLLASKMKAVFKKEFEETQVKTQERNKKIVEVFNKKLNKINEGFIDSINILRSDL